MFYVIHTVKNNDETHICFPYDQDQYLQLTMNSQDVNQMTTNKTMQKCF